MKIGILGGTFDPIHNGHLMIGRYARDLFSLDEIWVMPNGNPPHKTDESIETPSVHRIEMVKRAITNEIAFVLQPYEVERKETNYSFQTMEHFKKAYPEHDFYFIIGADSLFAMESWAHPERLLKTCTILAAFRDGKNTQEMEEQIRYLNQKYAADIKLLHTPDVDISSSEIREALKVGMAVHDQVPQNVLSYIKEYGLYADHFHRIKEDLSKKLQPARYQHTLGVVSSAEELAKCYGEDLSAARMAALLHDCAKYLNTKALMECCSEHGISISPSEEKNASLLHAKVGTVLAKRIYGITDERILNAIYYHTTGRPNMTLLEQIIYVADYIEPNRVKAPNLAQLRRLALEDLDECTCQILEATLAYLRDGNEVIDPTTEETYWFYKQKIQNKQKG